MKTKLDWEEISRDGFRLEDIFKEILDKVKDLDDTLPCYENKSIIYYLELAIHWDQWRTKRRVDQGIQGTMEPHTF